MDHLLDRLLFQDYELEAVTFDNCWQYKNVTLKIGIGPYKAGETIPRLSLQADPMDANLIISIYEEEDRFEQYEVILSIEYVPQVEKGFYKFINTKLGVFYVAEIKLPKNKPHLWEGAVEAFIYHCFDLENEEDRKYITVEMITEEEYNAEIFN